MNPDTIIGTAIGVIVGGLITWFVAWLYYRRASEDLKAEAVKLSKLSSMVLTGMEVQGLVQVTRDADGIVTGWKPITGSLNVTLDPVTLKSTGELRAPE